MTAPTLTRRDAWLLACFYTKTKPVDIDAVSSSLAKEACRAMSSNGKTPLENFSEWLNTLEPDMAKAVTDAVFAEDPVSEPQEDSPPSTLSLIHWADEALEPQDPIDWVVGDLISRDSVNIVFGNPGTYKTWLFLDLAICVAAGIPWLNFTTTQGTVLIIDEESGPQRLNRRLAKLMRGHGLGKGLPLAYTSLVNFNLRQQESVEELQKVIKMTNPSLVVIDALSDIMVGGDENAVKDVQPVMQVLRKISNIFQIAVVVIHHANRQGTIRGSIAIPGAIELSLQIECKNGNNIVDFETIKLRDISYRKFAAEVMFDELDDKVLITPVAAKAKSPNYSKGEQFVIQYLKDHGPSSLSDIERHADTCSPHTAKKAVYSLTTKGIIRRCDGGKPGEVATCRFSSNGARGFSKNGATERAVAC